VSVEAEDGGAGVDRWSAVINGREEAAGVLDGPWEAGRYEVAVAIFDGAGNRGTTSTVRFEVDGGPPELSWEPVAGGEPSRSRRPDSLERELIDSGVRWLEWSVDGDRWLPWFWDLPASLGESTQRRLQALSRRPVVESDHPQILLRAPAGSPLAEPSAEALEGGGALRVRAEDRPAGVERLEMRAVPEGEPMALEIVAVDLLGHSTAVEWTLGR
jgi:hypothetical protein